MLRIYLDWNIINNLGKQNKTKIFSDIWNVIENNKEIFLFPYSISHIEDLSRSYNDKNEYLEQDLEFLENLSGCHLLHFDGERKIVSPVICSPIDYFKKLIEDKSIDIFDFTNILTDNEDEIINKIGRELIELLQKNPTGIDTQFVENLPEQYNKLKELLKETLKDNNFYSLIQDFLRALPIIDNYSDLYKTFRNHNLKDLKIDTTLSNWGHPFTYLTKLLKKYKVNNSFRDLILNESNEEHLSRYDSFMRSYIALDMFGFHRDEKLANLLEDANHVYCGAFCDLFVTEDKRTYNKAKAIYKEFNIDTIVCDANEFVITVESCINLSVDNIKNSLFAGISYVFNNHQIIQDDIDDEGNPVKTYKIESYLLDYFNRLQVSTYQDSTVIYLYKIKANYSDFYFWTEIEILVKKLVEELGQDIQSKMYFDKEEELSIEERNWTGRLWIIDNSQIYLFYEREKFGLTLQIEFVIT